MTCKQCGKEHGPSGAICAGAGKRYIARVQPDGSRRRYQLLGKPTKSYRVALRRMTEAFIADRYKRGDVLMTADYYDPVQLCELVRS